MSKKGAWIGPLVVAGIVVIDLAGVGALLAFSQRDPGFGVEPDYYAKALAWDAARAQAERSERLGWSSALADEGPCADGSHRVSLTLTDAHGAPIEGATVRFVAFHNARSMNRAEALLSPCEPAEGSASAGRYETRLVSPRAGVWEFRITASRDDDTFVRTMRLTISTVAKATGTRGAP